MFLFIKPLRLALKAFITESTPGQLSMGLALGVLIGLVPKGNLLAIALGILLAATRANLGIAAATIIACSFLSPSLDPMFDSVGGYLLSHPSLTDTWTDLYNKPLVPWTDFNNSIVLGSFVVGVVLIYPLHRLTRPVFEKYSKQLAGWTRRYRITRYLLGAELVGAMKSAES